MPRTWRWQGERVRDQHPLKQGLRHCILTTKNSNTVVRDQHPLKQGLRLFVSESGDQLSDQSETNIH